MIGVHDLFNLRTRNPDTNLLNVVVETPRGCRNKFKYDVELGLFRLHKQLPRGAVFPFDFGFVPSTQGEDGDPLDLLVLMDDATFTGCLVTTRLLGAIEAEQKEGGRTLRNDRLIGVAETAKIRPIERSLKDLPTKVLDEIEHFFLSYNQVEGRKFEILGRLGPSVAAKLVDDGMQKFQEFGKQGTGKRQVTAEGSR